MRRHVELRLHDRRVDSEAFVITNDDRRISGYGTRTFSTVAGHVIPEVEVEVVPISLMFVVVLVVEVLYSTLVGSRSVDRARTASQRSQTGRLTV
jgi:hypothetical protein